MYFYSRNIFSLIMPVVSRNSLIFMSYHFLVKFFQILTTIRSRSRSSWNLSHFSPIYLSSTWHQVLNLPSPVIVSISFQNGILKKTKNKVDKTFEEMTSGHYKCQFFATHIKTKERKISFINANFVSIPSSLSITNDVFSAILSWNKNF